MRRNIDGTCSPSCCSNPNIRTINTMSADTQGNFTIRGDMGIHVTVGTNEVIISGIVTYYENTDGNIAIDNDLLTINLADDITITGDMIVAGDLTVNGTYYTVHAEHVYTQDDYIILREGAVTPLAAGSYAGFQVTKYDGTNDGRLVVDNAGVARVGDVGDEQPLLTRDEAADLTDGESLVWDAANSKAVTQTIPSAINTALAGKQNDLGIKWMEMHQEVIPIGGIGSHSWINKTITLTNTITDSTKIGYVSVNIGMGGYQTYSSSNIESTSSNQIVIRIWNEGSAANTNAWTFRFFIFEIA